MPRPERVSIGTAISRLTPEFDALVGAAEAYDAGSGRPGAARYHELEECAQRLAEAIVAPFRRPSIERPVHPPLFMERRADGGVKAGW